MLGNMLPAAVKEAFVNGCRFAGGLEPVREQMRGTQLLRSYDLSGSQVKKF